MKYIYQKRYTILTHKLRPFYARYATTRSYLYIIATRLVSALAALIFRAPNSIWRKQSALFRGLCSILRYSKSYAAAVGVHSLFGALTVLLCARKHHSSCFLCLLGDIYRVNFDRGFFQGFPRVLGEKINIYIYVRGLTALIAPIYIWIYHWGVYVLCWFGSPSGGERRNRKTCYSMVVALQVVRLYRKKCNQNYNALLWVASMNPSIMIWLHQFLKLWVNWLIECVSYTIHNLTCLEVGLNIHN